MVTQKINESSAPVHVENLEAKLNEVLDNNKSYSDKLPGKLEANNLATIIQETKNNDLIQMKEREMRSANLVIYGVNEKSEDEVALKEEDQSFISSFLQQLG